MSEKKYPKSYLSAEEREDLIKEGATEHLICICEADAAREANDGETYWQWLSQTRLATATLKKIKHWYGADFIRKWGFDTTNADRDLGKDWLDNWSLL